MLKTSSITPALANQLANIKAAIDSANMPEFSNQSYDQYVIGGSTWFDALAALPADPRNA